MEENMLFSLNVWEKKRLFKLVNLVNLIITEIFISDHHVNKHARSLVQGILQDSLDMSRFGFEQN